MYAEVKIRDKWNTVGHIFEYDYHSPGQPTTITVYSDSSSYEHNKQLTLHPYDGRNYELFSILADVRNRHGIKPIDEPRGLPDDLSQYIKNQAKDFDGHSHSWMNLGDLDSYDWDATYTAGYTAGEFYTKTVPALRGLLDRKGVEDVRIVYWFDN